MTTALLSFAVTMTHLIVTYCSTWLAIASQPGLALPLRGSVAQVSTWRHWWRYLWSHCLRGSTRDCAELFLAVWQVFRVVCWRGNQVQSTPVWQRLPEMCFDCVFIVIQTRLVSEGCERLQWRHLLSVPGRSGGAGSRCHYDLAACRYQFALSLWVIFLAEQLCLHWTILNWWNHGVVTKSLCLGWTVVLSQNCCVLTEPLYIWPVCLWW